MNYSFAFKLLALMTSVIHIVIGGQYGARISLVEKPLAKPTIDGRVEAILNGGGKTVGEYLTSIGKKVGKPSYREVDTLQTSKSTHRSVNVIPVDSYEKPIEGPVIEVSPSEIPVGIIFKTHSPKVNVEQRHKPGKPIETKKTRTEDEPQTVRHEVFKPVIQELTEVIQPYRRFIQKIQPVLEDIHQVVASRQPNKRPDSATGYTSSAPGYAQSATGYTQSAPGYTQSAPGYTQSAPGYTPSATYQSAPDNHYLTYPSYESRKAIPMIAQRYGALRMESLVKPQNFVPTYSHSHSQSQSIPTNDYRGYSQSLFKPSSMPTFPSLAAFPSVQQNYETQYQQNAQPLYERQTQTDERPTFIAFPPMADRYQVKPQPEQQQVPQPAPQSDAYPAGAEGEQYYKMPLSFDLPDVKSIKTNALNSVQSNSKVYELKFRPELNYEDNSRYQYTLASDLTPDDLSLIKASIDAKSHSRSAKS